MNKREKEEEDEEEGLIAAQGLYSFNTRIFEEDLLFKHIYLNKFKYSGQLHTLKSNVRVNKIL